VLGKPEESKTLIFGDNLGTATLYQKNVLSVELRDIEAPPTFQFINFCLILVLST
jgi:hypothetical protein